MAKRPIPVFSVIRTEQPVPNDITTGHVLIALYALQQWESFSPSYPQPIAAGYFYKNLMGIMRGLSNISRDTAMHHLGTRVCLVCETPIDLQHSTGDHIIARHLGGPEAIQNAILLCRAHNSSKGTKDLLEWWLFKGYKVVDLPRTVLCLYARIHWQHYGHALLDTQAPAFLVQFLAERMAALPSDDHRISLMGTTYAGAGLTRWLIESN